MRALWFDGSRTNRISILEGYLANRLKIALVGAGQMAQHHARVIAASDHAQLAVVVDTDLRRAEQLASASWARSSVDMEEALACDAAVIATPTEAHLDVSLPFIEAGKPVLVEKPVAADVDETRRLIEASRSRDVPLMCGFVERFNPVIKAAADYITDAPIHLVSVRHSPAATRIATSVVYDLLIHDIDIAIRFSGGDSPTASAGSTWKPPQGHMTEVADCTMTFSGGGVATLSSSRASQRKIRLLYVSLPKLLIELDLLRQNITLFRHVSHEQVAEEVTTYRSETVIDIPFVRQSGEPLALQFQHFVGLMRGETDPEAERVSILPAHEVAAKISRI